MSRIERFKEEAKRRNAMVWSLLYRWLLPIRYWINRYLSYLAGGLLLALVALSFYSAPALQEAIPASYRDSKTVAQLSSLILGLGTALVGATAIVTSLVLFALQINIERMPYGLFKRLSQDLRLLTAFALAFLLAIGATTLSLVVVEDRSAIVVIAFVWSVILILALFLYAYRRALRLINPIQQLIILVEGARKELSLWNRRANRMVPLLESRRESEEPNSRSLARAAFFRLNSHWTGGAKRSIEHAMSFSRHYAEAGDYEVSEAALNAVTAINDTYVRSKAGAFYAANPFFENPQSHDDLINSTLEHLRKNGQAGIARKDELQIEQTLRSFALLVRCYLQIEYPGQHVQKSHAALAASYLASAVESVAPQDMADVLLEGQRLLGRSAQETLALDSPENIVTLVEKIALVACAGIAKENHRPVTMEGMSQLADLTVSLLTNKSVSSKIVFDYVRENVEFVSKLFLKTPEPPLSSNHSTYLGPYYSLRGTQSLRVKLTSLANAVLDAEASDENAKTVIRNLMYWSDDLYHTQKTLLLAAIDARSNFTFDITHWIAEMAEVLLAVSNAQACSASTAKDLRSHAIWLLGTLTWIPDDEDVIRFVESSQITETLFKSALDASNRGLDAIANEVASFLLSWTFKGGKYPGWAILERGLCACALLAQKMGTADELLENTAKKMNQIEIGLRLKSGEELLEIAGRVGLPGHRMSLIDHLVSEANPTELSPLLQSLGKLLSAEDS